MIFLSWVLKDKANRLANIIASAITIPFVIVGGSAYLHYYFFATIEIVCIALIIWYAGSGLNRKVRLMNDKVYEKYAWIVFFAIGAITIVAAVPHALGLNTDPALVESIAGKSIDDLKSSNSDVFQLVQFLF